MDGVKAKIGECRYCLIAFSRRYWPGPGVSDGGVIGCLFAEPNTVDGAAWEVIIGSSE